MKIKGDEKGGYTRLYKTDQNAIKDKTTGLGEVIGCFEYDFVFVGTQTQGTTFAKQKKTGASV